MDVHGISCTARRSCASRAQGSMEYKAADGMISEWQKGWMHISAVAGSVVMEEIRSQYL